MPLDLYVDPTLNELAFDGRGELRLVGESPLIDRLGQSSSNDELYAQRIRWRLKTQRADNPDAEGGWFLNIEMGVDWLGNVLVKNPDLGAIRAELVAVIVGTDGVDELLALDIDLNLETRQLTVSFTARTRDGVIDTSGVFGE